MALKLAKDSALTNVVSSGDNSNPLTTSTPISGGTQEIKVFLFNDNNAKYYSGITITPTDSVGSDQTWIQLAPDNAGAAGTYGTAGSALSMADIGSSGTPDTAGHPFWVKVTTPVVADSQNVTEVKLKVDGNEFAV